MKSTFATLLFGFSIATYSQVQFPEAYLEFGGYFEEQLDVSSYYDISIGVEPFAYKFIAPDVEISYYFGSDQDEDWDFDESGEISFRSYLNRNFDAWVWGIGPKLFLEDDFSRIVLIPKYHFGTQKATGDYVDSNQLELRQVVKSKFNYWSVSLGYEFLGVDTVGKLGIYLTYSGFNAGKSLNQIDYSEFGYGRGRYNTKAIGVGVRLSTGFKKRRL